MKKTRLLALLLAVCTVIGLLAGCGGDKPSGGTSGGSAGGTEKVVFKLGHVNGMDSVQQKCAEYMNELLAQRLPKYEIEIHGNSQLGGERDMAEAVQLGSLDMEITASTPLANFCPEIAPLEILYLIQSYEHADAVLEGEFGEELLASMRNNNIVGLAWTETGFRHFCNVGGEINKLDDIQGLKLRVMEHNMHVEGWRVMGVDAITTSWSDAMTGMQQGTMDAIEVPWSIFWANGAYDVCKNIAETYHLYCAQAFIMSEKAWAKVDEADRETFLACAKEAAKMSKTYNRDSEETFRQNSIAAGVTVTTPDLAEWQAKGEEVVAYFSKDYGEQIKKIQALNPNK